MSQMLDYDIATAIEHIEKAIYRLRGYPTYYKIIERLEELKKEISEKL